ncbi:MAG TPA: hypothetical protein VMZ27_13250 [Candidatus Saccharimonadales bacterium]|nr:hypothetical protein [Candidatus Saccharimonadales bacterium]
MKHLKPFAPSRFIWLGILLSLCSAYVPRAAAEDLYLISKLIWGTNDEKVNDPKLKAMDPAMEKKFQNVFKWKHYYQVTRKDVMIPHRSSRQLEMSKRCTLEITELEGPKVEVTLIGQGKPLHKIVKPLSKGEYFTIAGGDKDETAWFILISQVDFKEFKGEIIPKSQLPIAKTGK